MVDAVEHQEEDVCVDEHSAVADDLFILGEESDCGRGKYKEEQGDQACYRERHGDRGDGASVSPVFLIRADVLADEGGRRHGHA